MLLRVTIGFYMLLQERFQLKFDFSPPEIPMCCTTNVNGQGHAHLFSIDMYQIKIILGKKLTNCQPIFKSTESANLSTDEAYVGVWLAIPGKGLI